MDNDGFGHRRLEIKLLDDDARRKAISLTNDTVDLMCFKPMLMSMSEIFINAVRESNDELPPDFNPDMMPGTQQASV